MRLYMSINVAQSRTPTHGRRRSDFQTPSVSKPAICRNGCSLCQRRRRIPGNDGWWREIPFRTSDTRQLVPRPAILFRAVPKTISAVPRVSRGFLNWRPNPELGSRRRLFRAQAASYHLQVQGQAHRRPGNYDTGCVGQVKPLGRDDHIDQHFEGSFSETGYRFTALFAAGIAQDNRQPVCQRR